MEWRGRTLAGRGTLGTDSDHGADELSRMAERDLKRQRGKRVGEWENGRMGEWKMEDGKR